MQVSYNGVQLQVVHTLEASRQAVMSDDGAELLYVRHTYDFECIYNPKATSYTGANPPSASSGNLPSTTDKALRMTLMHPQQQLLIKADEPNSPTVLQSPAPGYTVDANNGPVPLSCTVKAITPRTWRVAFRIRTDIIECDTGDDEDEVEVPPIISNRWSQTQHTGLDHRTTIITRGVTVFRTDQLTDLKRAADYYRFQCIPGLPITFQRQSVQVAVNSTGNILSWEVQDQEQFRFIGATSDPKRMGVVKFEGVFSTRSGAVDDKGVPTTYLIGRFDCTAWGDAQSSRQGMFDWLAKLAVERCAIPAGAVNPDTQSTILSVETDESLEGMRVGLHITVRIPPGKENKQGLGTLRTDFIGVDVINTFSNDGLMPQFPSDNNTRGTANVQMFVNALKLACSTPFNPPKVASAGSGPPDDNTMASTYEVQVYEGEPPPETTSRYSDDAVTKGTYTEMSVESKHTTYRGVLGCPIASSTSVSGGGTATTSGGTGLDPLLDGGDDDSRDVEILTIARPMTVIEYTFEAERTTIPPRIPNPEVSDKNLVLLSDELSPMAVGLAPDGQTPVYRIGGKYKYIAKKARQATAALAFGVHPWTDFNYDEDGATLQTEQFVHGIIDSPDEAGDEGGDGEGGPYAPGIAV